MSTAHHLIRTTLRDLFVAAYAGEPVVVTLGTPQQWTDLTFSSAGPFEWVWLADSSATLTPEGMHGLGSATPQRTIETVDTTLGIGTVRTGDRTPGDASERAAELFDTAARVLREDPSLGIDLAANDLTHMVATVVDWEHNELPLGNRLGWGSLYSVGVEIQTGHQ